MTIDSLELEPQLHSEIPGAQSAGALLKVERERRGLSEKLVADKLHITMHYVRAIESDHYEKLPGKVFAKGYIKSYAILLDQDVSEIVRRYDEHCDFRNEEVEKKDRLVAARRKKDQLFPWLMLAIAAFIVGFIVLWIYTQFFSNADDAGTTALLTNELRPEQMLALEVSERGVLELPLITAGSLSDKDTPFDLTEFKAKRVIEVFNVGSDLLEISFSGKCWVEVIDSGSTEIYREIQQAGDVVRLTGTAPFRILLGDAPFVSVRLNGQAVDVNGKVRIDKSARLIVGL